MAQDLASTVREQLSGMGRAERQRAIESLRSVMLDAMYQTERESADYEARCCPRCGCVEMVRKGHCEGRQPALPLPRVRQDLRGPHRPRGRHEQAPRREVDGLRPVLR
jgi:hypothetical protein